MRPIPSFPILIFIRHLSTTPLTLTLTPARTTSKLPTLSLSSFLLRQRVLSLWRDIVRATNKIPKASPTRTEMKAFAREEFERNREVRDAVKIRYLVSTGRTQLEEMRRGFGAGL